MKLEVPFHNQETNNDCGPTALQMVLEYLDRKSYSRDQIQTLVDSDKSGVTWTIGLAKSAAQMGFKTEFYTSCLGFNPENYKLAFYQETADEKKSTEKKLNKLKREAVQFGVHMEEKRLTLKEILIKIGSSCVPIILLDWSKIKATKGFIGHFVPIVGYDNNNIYIIK